MHVVQIPAIADTYLQSGASAQTNFGNAPELLSKVATDVDHHRRVLLKFHTEGHIPRGTTLTKAVVRMAVMGSGTSAARPISAHTILRSFLPLEATWLQYRSGQSWSNPGGDFGPELTRAPVSSAHGPVEWTVTAHAQAAVNGPSRYMRLALRDRGPADPESLRAFASGQHPMVAARPILELTYGPPIATLSTSNGATLRAVQWNVHKGISAAGGNPNLALTGEALVILDGDVYSLNECQWHMGLNSSVDMVDWLANYLRQKTGARWVAYRAPGVGSMSSGFGNAILTKLPVVDSSIKVLTPSSREGRACLRVGVRVGGHLVHVFSTHVDYFEPSSRTVQTKEVRDWTSTFSAPRVVLGDFNTSADTSDGHLMSDVYSDAWRVAQGLGMALTYRGSGETRGGARFDYCYLTGTLQLQRCEVVNMSNGGVYPSDHDPVVTTLHLG